MSDQYNLSAKNGQPPLNDDWVHRRRAAKAMHEITERLVTSDTSIDQAKEVADQLEAVIALLEGAPRIEGKKNWADRYQMPSFGRVGAELDPLRGESNPLSLHSRFWIEDDKAHAIYRGGWAFEGPPGRMHGGYVAAIFDNFLGMAQVLDGNPGMTGTLKVNYHRATPLHVDLQLTAEIIRVEGRSKIVRGVMMANGEKTASCEGLFIRPREGFNPEKS